MTPKNLAPAAVLTLAVLAPASAQAQMLQLCAQQPAGFVIAIQQTQNCGQLPGNWEPLDLNDGDWDGAGTGAMRPANPSDRVAVGDVEPEARLHVGYTGQEDGALVVENPRTRAEALRVGSDGRTVLGGVSGTSAQLTVNAPEGEEVVRARAGGITSFVVAGDGQVGVGTSTPGAALEVSAQGDEDPLHVTTPGAAQPALVFDADGDLGIGVQEPDDRISVFNDGTRPCRVLPHRQPGQHRGGVVVHHHRTGKRVVCQCSEPRKHLCRAPCRPQRRRAGRAV